MCLLAGHACFWRDGWSRDASSNARREFPPESPWRIFWRGRFKNDKSQEDVPGLAYFGVVWVFLANLFGRCFVVGKEVTHARLSLGKWLDKNGRGFRSSNLDSTGQSALLVMRQTGFLSFQRGSGELGLGMPLIQREGCLSLLKGEWGVWLFWSWSLVVLFGVQFFCFVNHQISSESRLKICHLVFSCFWLILSDFWTLAGLRHLRHLPLFSAFQSWVLIVIQWYFLLCYFPIFNIDLWTLIWFWVNSDLVTVPTWCFETAVWVLSDLSHHWPFHL